MMDKLDWIAKGKSFQWARYCRESKSPMTPEERRELEQNMARTYRIWGLPSDYTDNH